MPKRRYDPQPANHLPHHRITRQTIRIIYVLTFGQPPKDRLSQQTNQRMPAIVASSRVAQKSARNVVQAEDFIEFPEQPQTAV